jgi:hypothetical protein
MLWLAILPLFALVAPRFAAEVFSPRRRRRMTTQLAAARIDVDMTRL